MSMATPRRPSTPQTQSQTQTTPTRSPRSPRTPRRQTQMTPLTRKALDMSVTPTRNRLLFTPTRNKQNHVYDPIGDLKQLGRLFRKEREVRTQTQESITVPVRDDTQTGMDVSIVGTTRRTTNVAVELDGFIVPAMTIQQVSPLPSQIPSFVHKDVRHFATLVDSSFSASTTFHPSDTSFDDTVPITQTQTQSQSQQEVDEIPDFEFDFANSSVAVPEAMLADTSGVFADSSDDDDDDEEEGEVVIDGVDNLMDRGDSPTPIRRRQRSSQPSVSAALVRRTCEMLDIPLIPVDVFNEISERFIDIELERSLKLSKAAGLQRIVYTDTVIGEENVLLDVVKECDMETVKNVEGVLYGNASLRKKRRMMEVEEARTTEMAEIVESEDTADTISSDVQDGDSLSDSDSSTYSIAVAEEESDVDE